MSEMVINNIAEWAYTPYDKELVLTLTDGTEKILYCPSDCLYNVDTERRIGPYYCYDTQMYALHNHKIKYVTYCENNRSSKLPYRATVIWFYPQK